MLKSQMLHPRAPARPAVFVGPLPVTQGTLDGMRRVFAAEVALAVRGPLLLAARYKAAAEEPKGALVYGRA